ncbi:PAS domain-containing sensor histidine kinase [Clostridium vincentii]|uniref:PAS domain-containing sensor histidine kinase n=1 Tax=Clostridium vincentii TaxID=52704 RepID=UPI001FA9235E|nr:PAS domain-containing sensor histidine kinase [Clostridium vincentii]
MKNTFNNGIKQAYLYSCNSIITKVNKNFIDLTGFTIDEVLGKSLIEIEVMLKINSQITIDNIDSKYSGYIFTKSHAPREVTISLLQGREINEKIYTFVEKLNSRLEDKLIFVEQTFMDNISGAAIYSVPDLILLKANKKYLNFMYPPFNREGNSIGRYISELVIGFIGSKSEVVWNDVLKTQKTSHIKEFEFHRFAGGIVYFDSWKTPIFEKGKMKYIFATAIDVTERVLKNQNIETKNKIIEEQKNELESIIENISNAISIFNKKGRFISFNKSAKEMYPNSNKYLDKVSDGYTKAEIHDIYGEKIDLKNTPACRVMRGEKFKNMRTVINFPHKTLQLDVSGIPIYDRKEKFALGVLCSRDMTDDFNKQEVIISKYELMNRIIDTFDLPVVRVSCPELKIVGINKKAFSITKSLKPDIISMDQLKGSTIEDLYKPLKPFDISKYHKYIDQVLKEKKTKYLNKKSHLINGKQVYWNIILEPILEVNEEIQEILIVVIDVTAETNSNLVMENTLKLQGEFLANISHELKTPLNVIYSVVQLFSMYCNSDSLDKNKKPIIKYIESMKKNCYRLSKLINNIVDSSKIEAGFFELNLSNNNIVEVIEEIVMSVTNFTEIKGLNIIFDTDTEEKIIACDPEKIERIVLNLISNAIKFSNPGDEILVDIKDKDEFVEISVKDNGIGIKAKNLGIIFDRFKQVDKSLSRNAEGTGIGLSLVKSIVELHGGSISVESELGKGSKFTVLLPTKEMGQENMLPLSNLKNINETIKVEFSDVNLY